MIDIKQIEAELHDGLTSDRQRISDASKNLDFYRGDFCEHMRRLVKEDPNNREDVDIHRYTMTMRFFVDKLSEHLYRGNPTRTVQGSDEATKWLQKTYSQNKMFARWQAAHRHTFIGDAVAFQVAGTADPKNPIKIHLWRADQFAVWTDPNDPTEVAAVVTIDRTADQKKRYTVWTDQVVTTYEGERKGDPVSRFLHTSTLDNTYGVLPFSFAHNQYPTMEFWSGGPGSQLRQTNEYLNLRLKDTAEGIVYGTNPVMQLINAKSGYPMPRIRPGLALNIPPKPDSNGMPSEDRPEVIFSSPDLSFITMSWDDIENYMKLTMLTFGIPETAFNFRASAGRSGVSIIAEQAPLVLMARSYQQSYQHYETELARVALRVAVAHGANNGTALTHLSTALDDLNLSVKWGEMFSELPGAERDRADEWSVLNNYSSKHQVYMRREGCTWEEADEHLEQVAADLKREQEIFGELEAAAPRPPMGFHAIGDQQTLPPGEAEKADDKTQEETDGSEEA